MLDCLRNWPSFEAQAVISFCELVAMLRVCCSRVRVVEVMNRVGNDDDELAKKATGDDERER